MNVFQHNEYHKTGRGSLLRDTILGGQDGLVNVLGIILGIAIATTDVKIIIIAGFVAAFAESISMGAVAYTSTKASKDFYKSEYERERYEVEHMPSAERKEIRDIYYKKGFRRKSLDDIVKKITSDKKVWIDTMMIEELNMFPESHENPLKSAVTVFFSALFGSFIPIIPFFFGLTPFEGVIASLIISIATLFCAGYAKAKLTIGRPGRSGVEMALIGIGSAVAGYIIGYILSVVL